MVKVDSRGIWVGSGSGVQCHRGSRRWRHPGRTDWYARQRGNNLQYISLLLRPQGLYNTGTSSGCIFLKYPQLFWTCSCIYYWSKFNIFCVIRNLWLTFLVSWIIAIFAMNLYWLFLYFFWCMLLFVCFNISTIVCYYYVNIITCILYWFDRFPVCILS